MEVNKYEKSKIYQIVDAGCSKCYIGSTYNTLNKRMSDHRASFKKPSPSSTCVNDLFSEFGMENCKIELIEHFPCNSREELNAREGYHIKNNECINKTMPGLNMKSWRKEYDQTLYAKKRETILENKKLYYQHKKEEILEKKKLRIICECGCEMRVADRAIHMRTMKHKRLMEQQEVME